VWIDLAGTPINEHARTDGTDIFFTDGTGTALDYEIQHWDASTSLLEAWVRLPSLPSSANTTIYVEYGDLAIATAPNPSGVFKSSFIGVWHLDDTLETTNVVDSTGKSNGSASSLGSSQQVAAQLGGGIAFTGSAAQQIAFTNTLTGSSPSTFSAWVKQSSDSNTSAVITIGSGSTDEARFCTAATRVPRTASASASSTTIGSSATASRTMAGCCCTGSSRAAPARWSTSTKMA
jgi:hypothetical protein